MIYDGNLQVKRFRLEKIPLIVNEEASVDVDDDIFGNVTEHTVRDLLPGMTYTFTLIASNAAGDSAEKAVNVSMPADGTL